MAECCTQSAESSGTIAQQIALCIAHGTECIGCCLQLLLSFLLGEQTGELRVEVIPVAVGIHKGGEVVGRLFCCIPQFGISAEVHLIESWPQVMQRLAHVHVGQQLRQERLVILVGLHTGLSFLQCPAVQLLAVVCIHYHVGDVVTRLVVALHRIVQQTLCITGLLDDVVGHELQFTHYIFIGAVGELLTGFHDFGQIVVQQFKLRSVVGVALQIGQYLVYLLLVAGVCTLAFLDGQAQSLQVAEALGVLLAGGIVQLLQRVDVVVHQLAAGCLLLIQFLLGVQQHGADVCKLFFVLCAAIGVFACLVHYSVCVIQYGEFVQVDVLVVDGVHEGVAVQHIAQFARACCFIHSGSVVAVGQHLGGIRQHFIGGVAVHQGRCSSLGRQSCLLCM